MIIDEVGQEERDERKRSNNINNDNDALCWVEDCGQQATDWPLTTILAFLCVLHTHMVGSVRSLSFAMRAPVRSFTLLRHPHWLRLLSLLMATAGSV